eukprot:2775928-Alexandrium_andersonii.AAC.1
MEFRYGQVLRQSRPTPRPAGARALGHGAAGPLGGQGPMDAAGALADSWRPCRQAPCYWRTGGAAG